ncbi:MAG: hypothetical protein E7656_04250 [Ruminococcaceae bacterium]|nr:hypothetical protein [Oscillospiraceae bacterium]
MKDKLSSFLSKIKNRSFVRKVSLILMLAALTAAILAFSSLAKKENAYLPVSAPVFDEPSDEAIEDPEPVREEEKEGGDIPESDVDKEDGQEVCEKEYIPVGDIRIPHCGDINYSLSSKTSDFRFENPSENACFLKVNITRLDTKEIIYSSTLISPGKGIASVGFAGKLTKPGSYDAMIKVDAYAIDRMMHLNSLAIDAVIHAY